MALLLFLLDLYLSAGSMILTDRYRLSEKCLRACSVTSRT